MTAVIILLAHIIFFHHSFDSFVHYLKNGYELGALLGGGHSFSALFVRLLCELKSLPGLISHRIAPWSVKVLPYAIVAVWVCSLKFKSVSKRVAISLSFYLLLLAELVCRFEIYGISLTRTNLGAAGLMLIWAALLVCWAGGLFSRNSPKLFLRLPVFLIFLAVAYAFGSINGLIRQMSGAYIFLCSAAMVLSLTVDHKTGNIRMSFLTAIYVAISTVIILLNAQHHPYRLPTSIWRQNNSIQLWGAPGGSLDVDDKTFAYVTNLQQGATASGWREGTPLVDLTGASPGALVILGASITGTPWLLGGYKGSNQFVAKALSQTPISVLNAAWVLTAPKGRRHISSLVLRQAGVDFPDSFVRVAIVKTGWRNEKQILWKPKDSEKMGK